MPRGFSTEGFRAPFRLQTQQPLLEYYLYSDFYACSYADFRLIDIPSMRSQMPLTLESLKGHVIKSSLNGSQLLRKQWIVECCAIVDNHREEIEAWMPSGLV